MKKITKIIDWLTPICRLRDLFYILLLSIGYEFATAQIHKLILGPPYHLCALVCFALMFAVMSLIYSARWYKLTTGKSLYGALLSPDREGNIFQLISRARKEHADRERNRSKGWNTKTGSSGVLLGYSGTQPIVSPTEAEEHILCIGGSDSGKTRNILIPTAERWRGGLFAIDISGDIYRAIKEKSSSASMSFLRWAFLIY